MSFGFQVLGFGAYPSRGGPIDATYLVIAGGGNGGAAVGADNAGGGGGGAGGFLTGA